MFRDTQPGLGSHSSFPHLMKHSKKGAFMGSLSRKGRGGERNGEKSLFLTCAFFGHLESAPPSPLKYWTHAIWLAGNLFFLRAGIHSKTSVGIGTVRTLRKHPGGLGKEIRSLGTALPQNENNNLVVCLLRGHCQSSKILLVLELLDSKGLCTCAVFGLVQCGEPQSRLDTYSRLGAPLSWEMKLGRSWADMTVTLFLGYFCSQRSWVASKWF